MQRVTGRDLPAVRDLLWTRPHHAMFPLSNLDRFGLDGSDDLSVSMWWDGASVLSLTQAGMAMPFGDLGAAPDMAAALGDRPLIGVIGAQDVARAFVKAAGIGGAATTLDRDEPQFLLDLSDLVPTDLPGALVPLDDVPCDLIERWIAEYDVEALGQDQAAARRAAGATWTRYAKGGTHRVMMVDDVPVALTGLNARAGDMVQVGGVYVPPALRGRGYARRAVTLDLARVRDDGARRATLFASGSAAVRAYRAIGFRWIGDWTLMLFDGPCTKGMHHG